MDLESHVIDLAIAYINGLILVAIRTIVKTKAMNEIVIEFVSAI